MNLFEMSIRCILLYIQNQFECNKKPSSFLGNTSNEITTHGDAFGFMLTVKYGAYSEMMSLVMFNKLTENQSSQRKENISNFSAIR